MKEWLVTYSLVKIADNLSQQRYVISASLINSANNKKEAVQKAKDYLQDWMKEPQKDDFILSVGILNAEEL